MGTVPPFCCLSVTCFSSDARMIRINRRSGTFLSRPADLHVPERLSNNDEGHDFVKQTGWKEGLMAVIYDAESRCWLLQLKTSSYCFALNADNTSLHHVYWGSRLAPEALIEMVQRPDASTSSHIPFESLTGIAREEYAPWGE